MSKNKLFVSKLGIKTYYFPFPFPKMGTGKSRSLIRTFHCFVYRGVLTGRLVERGDRGATFSS
jgi:hypothetical protein